MEACTYRLYTLILNMCACMTYRKQILLAIILVCLVGFWLVGMAHIFPHTPIHEAGFLPHPLNDHDPWD